MSAQILSILLPGLLTVLAGVEVRGQLKAFVAEHKFSTLVWMAVGAVALLLALSWLSVSLSSGALSGSWAAEHAAATEKAGPYFFVSLCLMLAVRKLTQWTRLALSAFRRGFVKLARNFFLLRDSTNKP